ncbi:MAG: YncE family protein [Alphaproteobacteria bacterium]|nr:YncE family protein [Alphaproteobacteria bacterium]
MNASSRRLFLAGSAMAGLSGVAGLPSVAAGQTNPPQPAAPAASPVVVMNSGEDSLSFLDPTTYREIERRPIGREPHHWALTPDRRELVIGNAVGNELVFLDAITGRTLRRIERFSNPYHLLFSPDGRFLVVAELRLDAVAVYRAADYQLLTRIRIPRMVSHIVISPDSRFAYLTVQQTGRLIEVDLEQLQHTWTMDVGPEPAGIILAADNRTLGVAIMGSDHLAMVDRLERRIVNRVRTGRGAHAFPQLFDEGTLFISNRVDNTVSQLDHRTLQVLRSFPIPGGPDCLALTPDRRELWITGRVNHHVMVMDVATGQLKHRIRVGRSPHGIYIAPHA